MKKYLSFLLLFSVNAFAQHSVTIFVTDNSPKAGAVYMAGNFNNWNPGDSAFKFTNTGPGTWKAVLNAIPDDTYELKFTQGSWDNVEVDANNVDIENRKLIIDKDTVLHLTIARWKEGVTAPRKHTASANVHILDTAFYIPQLKRARRIWVYLPANYYSSTQKYPVLYMHDGQNLFDEYTAANGEWGVDEALDSLQKQSGQYCIVVGIDHGGDKRLTEYNPFDNAKYGREEGVEYVDFLVNNLKPTIDKTYRTKTDAANTAIAGSSMGGLISTYAILKYPNVFGAAGIFSPAYWIAPQIKTMAKDYKWRRYPIQLWFYAGGKESTEMLPDMEEVSRSMRKKSPNIKESWVPNAHHNEAAWRTQFPGFYTWWINRSSVGLPAPVSH